MRHVMAILVLEAAMVSSARSDAPATKPSSLDRYPAKLHEFVVLIESLEAAEAKTRDARWREVYRTGFDGIDLKSLKIVRPEEASGNPELAERMVRSDRVDGRTVLRFDVSDFQQGLLAIGPVVTGDFAIEFVGASISQRLNDLSVFCGDTSSGTGFQFGGYENTRNLLLLGMHEDGGETRSLNVDVSADVLLERGRWYRVRLEMTDGEVRGFIDGSLIGRARVGNRYDASQPRQPTLYAYASEVAIDEFRVLVADPNQGSTTRPDTPPATLEQDLQRLAGMLDDDDFRVRELAADLLRRVGPRAVPVLRRLQGTGSLEMQERIREVLSAIEPSSRRARGRPDAN